MNCYALFFFKQMSDTPRFNLSPIVTSLQYFLLSLIYSDLLSDVNLDDLHLQPKIDGLKHENNSETNESLESIKFKHFKEIIQTVFGNLRKTQKAKKLSLFFIKTFFKLEKVKFL